MGLVTQTAEDAKQLYKGRHCHRLPIREALLSEEGGINKGSSRERWHFCCTFKSRGRKAEHGSEGRMKGGEFQACRKHEQKRRNRRAHTEPQTVQRHGTERVKPQGL